MLNGYVLFMACLIYCQMSFAAGTIYQVTFADAAGAKMLNVDFQQSKPSPQLGEQVLRSSLEAAILVDPSKNIVATLFFRDEFLREDGYTGQLVYIAEDEKVVSWPEYLAQY